MSFFGLESLPSSVKELLLSNSQSKSCKSAKFWVIVGFQEQVYFEIDDVIVGDVIAKVFEKNDVLMARIVNES